METATPSESCVEEEESMEEREDEESMEEKEEDLERSISNSLNTVRRSVTNCELNHTKALRSEVSVIVLTTTRMSPLHSTAAGKVQEATKRRVSTVISVEGTSTSCSSFSARWPSRSQYERFLSSPSRRSCASLMRPVASSTA